MEKQHYLLLLLLNYKVYWSDQGGAVGTIARIDLAASVEYSVTVVNDCGAKKVLLIRLLEPNLELLIDQSKTCDPLVVASVANPNPPLTYRSHSPGLTTNSVHINVSDVPGVQFLTTQDKFVVTVKDNNGCTMGASITPNIPYVQIQKTDACAGANGRIHISVTNPVPNTGPNVNFPVIKAFGVPIAVKSLYNPCSGCPIGLQNLNLYSGNIENISAGTKVPITVETSSCTFSETVELKVKPTKKIFVGSDKNKGLCKYREVCDGVTLKTSNGKDVIFAVAGTLGPTQITNKLFRRYRCGNSLTCPNLEDPTKKGFDGGKVDDKREYTTVGEYIAFLEKEKINNPGNAALAEEAIKNVLYTIASNNNNKDNVPMDLCNKLYWCPFNTYAVIAWGGVKANVGINILVDLPVPIGDNCWEYKCGGVTKKVCPPNPDVTAQPDPPIDNCNPTVIPFAQLMVWYNDLVVNHKKFVGSSLQKHLDTYKNDERANCTKVMYCQNDFMFLEAGDPAKVNCVPINSVITISTFPNIKTSCTVNPLPAPNPNNKSVALCLAGGAENTPVNYASTPVYISNNPKYDPLAPPPFSSRILASNEATTFGNMGFVKFDGLSAENGFNNEANSYLPNAIMYGETQNYYNNFLDYSAKSVELGDVILDIVDLEKEEEVSISNIVENRLFSLEYSNSKDISWGRNIEAADLKVVKLIKNETEIRIAGFFSETLNYEVEPIASTSSRAAFILKTDYEGNLLEYKVIDNIDEEKAMFYDSEKGINITGISTNGSVKLNEDQLNLKGESTIFDLNLSDKSILANFAITGDVKIEKVTHDRKSNSLYYLLSATSNSGLSELATFEEKAINKGEYLLVGIDEKGNLKWTQSIFTGDIDKLDMIVDNKNEIYLAATFVNAISLPNFKAESKGGKDLFFVKLNSDGRLLGYQHYGSEDDETVSQIYKYDETLIFGGEVAGSTVDRKLGAFDFTCLNLVEHQAYISNISDRDWILSGDIVDTKTQKYNVSTIKTDFDVEIYPNPFNNNLNININCAATCDYEVRITNTLGSTLWQKKAENAKGNTLFEVEAAQRLVNGVYFVEVKSSEGKTAVYRVVKN